MPVRSLKDATLKIADAGGSGGANVVTVDIEEGDLTFEEKRPNNIISDRGVLDHARKGNEEPIDWSFGMRFQSFSTHASTTPYDALTKTGGAAAWVSDEPSSDAYAVILEFTIADPAGGAAEVLTFARSLAEVLSFTEGDPHDTLNVSGRSVITTPAFS